MHFLILPGAQSKRNTFIKTTNNSLKSILPNNGKPNVTHTGEKFGWKFQINDKTKAQHKHDFAYYSHYPYSTCIEDYLGETGRLITESSADHCRKKPYCTSSGIH